MKKLVLTSILVLIGTVGCQGTIDKAVRETKYSAWEVVGVEKRDLLQKYVKNTKDAQEETKESFTDALDQLKKTYNFDGGKLESQYNSLNSAYNEADERAKQVKADIVKVKTVADDLFSEWQKEIGEITTPSLREKSRTRLDETKKRFGQLHASLKKSETKIAPVLVKLKDQVLYLKHNLNANAVASLKGESLRIENEIKSLVQAIEASIKESDQFIKDLE